MKKQPAFLDSIPNEPLLGFRVGADGKRRLLTYPGEKGILVVAPNRSGKGVSFIGVNCICHRSSLVLSDPKAQYATRFARWRAEVLGQHCYIIDPLHAVPDEDIPAMPGVQPRGPILVDSKGVASFGGPRLRAGFNLVEMIQKAKRPIPIAKMIAGAAIPVQGNNPFWSEASQAFLAGYMCFVALERLYEKPRTTRSVWQDLTELPKPKFDEMIALMASSSAAEGFCKRQAIEFIEGHDETVRNIRTTLKNQVGRIFDDPDILDCLSYTSVDFGLLQREPVTIFLVLPGYVGEQYANFFRVLLSCMFTQIELNGVPRPGSRPGKTLIIFDEFASLRRSETIREAVPRLPEYSVIFAPIVQDLNQLRTLYTDSWETFVSNAGAIQTFGGCSDNFTAEYFSKMTGTFTAETVSITAQAVGPGGSRSVSQAKRESLMPHEFMTLNAKPEHKLRQVVFYPGHGFTLANRLLYYADFPDYVAFYDKTPAARREREREKEPVS